MELKIKVEDINYESMAELLLPIIKQQAGDAVWTQLPFLTPAAAKTILSRMSPERKDAMLEKYINSNKDKIASLLEDLVKKQGISLHITDVQAER